MAEQHIKNRKSDKSESLIRFLNETRTNDVIHSHVLLGSPFGKFMVNNSRLPEFWKLYLACVNSVDVTSSASLPPPVYLAEKPTAESPVLVDVDLRTRLVPTMKLSEHIYSDKQVKRIISVYQETLREKVLQTPHKSAMTCILLEKDPYIIELNGIKFIKNGFHLHFPKCFIDNNVQEAFVIPIVKKELSGLFDNLYTIDGGTTSPNRHHHYDFIDSQSIKVHWLMYGSKKPNNSPYVATRCFLDDAVEVSFEEALGDYILPKLNGQTIATTCIGKVKSLLPRILSIRLHGRLQYYYKAKPSVCTPVFDIMLEQKSRRHEYEQKTISENFEEVTKLMDLISDDRANDRSDWLAIGFCLWNVTKGDDEGLMAWLNFSEKSDKYNEAECICIWNGMRPSNYTIGTLKYYAKTDNPYEYAQFCKIKGAVLLENAVEGGHNDLAKLLYNEYGQEFIYSTTDKTWYKFENHIWTDSDKNYDLSERISDDNGAIISYFKDYIQTMEKELYKLNNNSSNGKKKKRKKVDDAVDDDADAEDNIKAEKLCKKITVINKLIRQCKSSTFKQNVMKECQEVFRNNTFTDKLNIDPYLVAFKNGVYDFKNDCFREGNPEDYLSKCLPIEYKDYGTVDNPEVMEVEAFFRMVLTDEEVRTYFLDQICQLFVGGNEEKIFLIWTGSGNNGKSVTQRLFEKMLGPLAVKVSTLLVTGEKTRIGQAAPELARTGNGVRWVVMDEPSQDEKITTGTLKNLTGNDSYWARDLHQKGRDTKEIVPLYKMHMLCNKLPGIKNPDDASWQRIRVIPFESKFVDGDLCPNTYEEQMARKLFPQDKQFNQKIEGLLQPLAWYLISHWRNLKKTDRIVPDKVKIATGEYREENNNDPRQEFIDEYLVKSDTASVNVLEVYEKYKSWFKVEYKGEKMSLKKPTLAYFDTLLGKREDDRWLNWTWKDLIIKRMINNPMI